ncbi:MAG: hypothetical protein CVT80_01120 [Alphaproteobacteria bacterium HGW-Alphaproteobacteria-2]|nr:MAG: hypothetical protein CVT80_01120 [Alphaproteobacteria bacterium HGW-Alphaproteobacteria-2]
MCARAAEAHAAHPLFPDARGCYVCGSEEGTMTDTTSRAGKAGVQAVEFALDILEFVAQQGATVGVSELARAFGTSKNRIHRHLQTLVSTGYLLRDSETERYGISARLMALGHAVSESFEISSAARQVAEELRDALGHAVAISQPEPGGSRIVMLVRNRSNIEIAVKPGSLLEYHASAQGKITLAFGSPTLLEAALASDLSHLTPYTITAPERLRHEIEQVRRQRPVHRRDRPDRLGAVHPRGAYQRAGPCPAGSGGPHFGQPWLPRAP